MLGQQEVPPAVAFIFNDVSEPKSSSASASLADAFPNFSRSKDEFPASVATLVTALITLVRETLKIEDSTSAADKVPCPFGILLRFPYPAYFDKFVYNGLLWTGSYITPLRRLFRRSGPHLQ